MEQDNKNRRMGQNVAFYTALAVCLIAVGVGTWELLQPERAGGGASAVSSAVALPGDDSAAPGDDTAAGNWDAEGDWDADDGAAIIAEDGAASGDASGAEASVANKAEAVAEAPKAVSGAASVPKEAKSDAAKTNDAKSDAKAKDSKSDANAGDAKSDAKTEKADEKSKDSAAKSAKESKSGKTDAKSKGGKADAKAEKAKLSGEVVRPVEGQTVTGFSMDKLLYNETMRDWRTHDGIDIAADKGTAVVSARAGTVETVDADPIMGTTVTVRHADKWESVYASLSDMPEVEAGDEVIAGQVLGYVGETAASESALGPHLHFSALNDGVPVDPETFLA